MLSCENGKTTIVGTEAQIYHEIIALNKAYYERIAKEKSAFSAWLWMDRVNREVRNHIESMEDSM